MLNHLKEDSPVFYQFPRSPLLHYLPLLHHNNLVIVSNCIYSVSNCDDCRVNKLLPDNFLNEFICLHVHI